ncbi:MAG: hypothetical protein CMJ49_11560 [Planctomycetaceae bacterium]|nr:hypothetical protein [Planctomycetaceae bacterium]
MAGIARRIWLTLRRRAYDAWMHDRFPRELRASDVFLVSYPKSGRNWVAYFLAHLIRSRIPSAPDELTLNNWPHILPVIDRMTGVDTIAIRRCRDRPDPRVFATHTPHTDLLPRIVYIARDPRDVAVSYFHYQQRTDPHPITDMNGFLDVFLADRLWVGGWQDHVMRWLEQTADPQRGLLVRYEDLRSDPQAGFTRIVEFIGLRSDPVAVESAIQASSFDAMRKVEDRFGVNDARGDDTVRFTRSGRAGEWRTQLEPHQIARIQDTCGDAMAELGYAHHDHPDSPAGPAVS